MAVSTRREVDGCVKGDGGVSYTSQVSSFLLILVENGLKKDSTPPPHSERLEIN